MGHRDAEHWKSEGHVKERRGRMRDERYDGAMVWSDLKVSGAILK